MISTKHKFTEQDDKNMELISHVLRERKFPSEIQCYIPKVELYVFKPDSKDNSDWVSTGLNGLVVCTFDSISRTIQIHMINPLVQQIIYSHLNVLEYIQQSPQFFSFDAKVSNELNPYSKGSTELDFENNWSNPVEFQGYNYIIGFQLPTDADNYYANDFYTKVTAILKMKQEFKSLKRPTSTSSSTSSQGEKLSQNIASQKPNLSPIKATSVTNTSAMIRPPSMNSVPKKSLNFGELHKNLAPKIDLKPDSNPSSKYSHVTPSTPSQDEGEDEEQQMNSKTTSKVKKQSLFSKLFHKKAAAAPEMAEAKQPKISHRVSVPKNLVHVSHIAYSKETGFTNLNSEWKSMFLKAGITEEEMRDPQTAEFLMKGIGVLAEEHKVEAAVAHKTESVQPSSSSKSLAKKGMPPPIPTRPAPKSNLVTATQQGLVSKEQAIPSSKPDMLAQIRNFKLNNLSKVENHIDAMKKDEDKFTSRLAALIEMKRSERDESPLESDGEFSDA